MGTHQLIETARTEDVPTCKLHWACEGTWAKEVTKGFTVRLSNSKERRCPGVQSSGHWGSLSQCDVPYHRHQSRTEVRRRVESYPGKLRIHPGRFRRWRPDRIRGPRSHHCSFHCRSLQYTKLATRQVLPPSPPSVPFRCSGEQRGYGSLIGAGLETYSELSRLAGPQPGKAMCMVVEEGNTECRRNHTVCC